MSYQQIKQIPGRFPSPTPPPEPKCNQSLSRSLSNSSESSPRGSRLKSTSTSPIASQRRRRSSRLSSPTPSVQFVDSEAPSESISRANTPSRPPRSGPRVRSLSQGSQSTPSIHVPRQRSGNARSRLGTRENLSPDTTTPSAQRSVSDTSHNRPTSELNWVLADPIAPRDVDDGIRDRIRDFHKTLQEKRKRKEKKEAKISTELEDMVKPKEEEKAKVETGVIYIFRCTDPRWSGLVKIGWTRGSVSKRKGGASGIENKCKIKLETVWDSGLVERGRIAHCPNVEKLIHDDLANQRRKYKCDVCKTGKKKHPATHDEWFRVSEDMAIQTAKRWVNFMLHAPYDVYGVLKPEWEAHLQRTETWQTANDDSRWSRWSEFVDSPPELPLPPPPPPPPSTLQQCQIWLAVMKENKVWIFLWYFPLEFIALCSSAAFIYVAFWNSFFLLRYVGYVGSLSSVGLVLRGLLQADAAKISRLGILRRRSCDR